jgi:uncharacterized protein YbcI
MSLILPSESDPRGAPHPAPGASPGDVDDVDSVAISDQIVRLYLEAFGRGPTQARTYVQPQFAVCVLRDVLTTAERSLIDLGGRIEVEAARAMVNEAIDRRCVSIVETQTGRSVLSHLARTKAPVDLGVHFFLFDDVSVARDALRD